MRFVAMNFVRTIPTKMKDTIKSFTAVSLINHNALKKRDQPLKKKIRLNDSKQVMVQKIYENCSNEHLLLKKNMILCNSIGKRMGVIIATSPNHEIQRDIPNPFVKPYITIGRKYQDSNYYEGALGKLYIFRFTLYLTTFIDIDLFDFEEKRKISRLHAQVRFNPNTKKIEFKAIGRNDILLNGNPLPRYVWTPICKEDILVQINSNITFSVIYEKIPEIEVETQNENAAIIL